jgi:multidrug efflux pump subunit AcrA (membrane-fusion protein)
MINLNTSFMETFEELSRLNEATNFYASKAFWDAARENRLDDISFHSAFDEELKEFGLTDIFNAEGLLTNQGVYRNIKAAKDANPDSWALKALQRMWVLQFKDNVRPESQIRQEKAAAEKADREAKLAAQREQERIEREAKYAAAKKDWDILNEKFPAIQELIIKTAEEFAADKKAILKPNLEKAVQLKTEIEAVTKGIVHFYDQSERFTLARFNKKDNLIKIDVTLNELSERYPNPRIFVKVREFFGKTPSFHVWNKTAQDSTSFTVREIDEESIKSELLLILSDIWDVVSQTQDTLAEVQEEYDTIMTKVNTAKAAQSAVKIGKPVDPSFISKVLAEFAKGREAAQDAYDFYSDTTDGSAGAAYAYETSEALIAIGTYLVHCNWRAYIKDKEIATWRMTESVDDLSKALNKVFNAFCDELNIEIIK